MNISRRWFIGGAASLGAMAGCRMFRAAPGKYGEGEPALKFGVVSDVHVRFAADGKGLDKGNNCETLVHTFEWFRDQGVDAVMIAGDIADSGQISELEAVAEAWWKVFPNDRAPDGRKVERLFVYGNHDWEGFKYGYGVQKLYPDQAELARHILRTDMKAHWERIFHEPYSPIYRRDVKGYAFVGAHWQADCCRGREERAFDHVGDWFAANGRDLDPALPFFYFQHPHLKDTVYGSWAWGHDTGVTTRALSAFSNAVAFSGHSHYSLTDERSIWQGAFTALGTSSLRYTGMPYDQYRGVGYENTHGGGAVDPMKAMPAFPANDGRQGMLVKVYGDAIVFHRREFVGDRPLGDDWVMPLPAAESKPFGFACRAAKSLSPAFPAGARLVVKQAIARIRGGAPKRGAKPIPRVDKPAVEFTFPQASAEPKARVIEYEFTFAAKDAKPVVKHVLATGFNMPASDPRAVAEQKCVFAAETLPKPPYSVVVKPLSSIGRFGEAISCEVS